MIPEAAVEAAAKVTFEGLHDDEEWATVTPADRKPYLHQARAALEAAAPHMIELTDKAVGSIASASWDAIIDGAESWAGQDEETIRMHTETTRAVLEAACSVLEGVHND